jgi:large subunit ribosomal protein L44
VRVYLTQTPEEQIQLPSWTFPSLQGDVFTPGPEGAYTALPIVPADIHYGSSGKSGVRREHRS